MNLLPRRLIVGLLTGLVALSGAGVWALPAPGGKVILTLTGKIGDKNAGDTAVFDLAMLEKLPQHTFTTKTPWDKSPVKFSGPLLRDVLAAAKASGTSLKASALNDYKTTIPLDDAQKFDVLLAHKMNDKAISVRTKGPLFIIYPFDTKPELQSSVYYERSAWQLKSIEIE
jgi:hypothetical protein